MPAPAVVGTPVGNSATTVSQLSATLGAAVPSGNGLIAFVAISDHADIELDLPTLTGWTAAKTDSCQVTALPLRDPAGVTTVTARVRRGGTAYTVPDLAVLLVEVDRKFPEGLQDTARKVKANTTSVTVSTTVPALDRLVFAALSLQGAGTSKALGAGWTTATQGLMLVGWQTANDETVDGDFTWTGSYNAVASIQSVPAAAAALTQVQVWDGEKMVPLVQPVKVWDGTVMRDADVLVSDGTDWVTLDRPA